MRTSHFTSIQAAAETQSQQDFKPGKLKCVRHSNVLVKKVGGKPIEVLSRVTNFSITGLYVIANHIVRFDGARVTEKYEDALLASFDVKLTAASFYEGEISRSEYSLMQDAFRLSPLLSRCRVRIG
jgi:hypothetical protein